MKRKRANGRRKSVRPLAEETRQNDAALVADFGLEDDHAPVDHVVKQAKTSMSRPGLGKLPANEKTKDNVSSFCKTNISVLGGLSKLAASIAVNQSQGNDSYVKFGSTVEPEVPKTDTKMSDWQVDVAIEEAVNGRMENYPKSLREMIVATIKDMSKEAGGLANLSRSLVDNPVSNEPMVQPHFNQTVEENASVLRQDPAYREQELRDALAVIRKTMKLDAAEPFNVPVDPVELGLPDHFDVIDTPMDFGMICNNLENGLKYINSEDVYKDVECIWENCCKYNKKGSPILDLMKQVKANFMKNWMAAGLHREQPQAIDESSILRCNKEGKNYSLVPVSDNLVQLQQNEACSDQALDNQPWPVDIQAGQHDEENTDSTSIPKKCQVRGRTRCLKLLNVAGRIVITTNEWGQPIGSEASQFTSFLGLIARDGNLAPLTYPSWSKMPEENKENMWQKVLTKFDINPSSRGWVMTSLGKKWRNFKSLLKTNHYDTHVTDEERLADRDERVLPDQWSVLVSQWSSEKWQNISAKNKANRAQQKFSHASGKKSFARVREEERAKRPDGKELSKAELFILTRTRKNGQPVNEATAAVISQLRQSMAQQEDISVNSSKPQDDAYTRVMGQDRKGGVSLYGLGVTQSRLGTEIPIHTEAIKMAPEKNAEVLEMKEKLASVEQTCAQMAAQMAAMVSMMTAMQKSSPGENSPNVVSVTPVPVGLPNQSEPITTCHHEVSSQQTRGRKKKR